MVPLFFASLLGELLSLYFLPMVKLMGFLPFLLFAQLRLPLPKALWCAAGSGLLIDLYAQGSPLGFFALNYTLTLAGLYRYRKFFSEENFIACTLYGVLFSAVSAALHFCLYPVLDSHFTLSPWTIVTDLFCLPLIDGLYTFSLIFAPMLLYKQLKPKLGPLLHELSRITR